MNLYPHARSTAPTGTLTLHALIQRIAEGEWKEQVERIRSSQNGQKAGLKKKLPAVSLSRVGGRRGEAGSGEPTGYLQIDLDHVGDRLEELRELGKSDPHVAAGFVSPSGDGLKLILLVDGKDHEAAFLSGVAWVRARYKAEPDLAVKDPHRLCFVSYDADAWWNDAPEVLGSHTSQNGKPQVPPQKGSERPEVAAGTKPRPAFLDALEGVQTKGNGGWIARCPAHHDTDPSLSIDVRGKRVLVRCFKGCTPGKIVSAVGLTLRDLFLRPVVSDDAPLRERVAAAREGKGQTGAVCTMVLEELDRCGALFSHAEDPTVEAAMYFDRESGRLAGVKSDRFLVGLAGKCGLNRADTLWRWIEHAVGDAALRHGRAIVPEAYWARREGGVYVSCGESGMVRVTADGVEWVENGTDGVLFGSDSVLPEWDWEASPVDPFETCEVFRGLSCGEHAKLLFRLWCYAMPLDLKTKPVLCMTGPVGSGKTATLRAWGMALGLPDIIQGTSNGDKAEESFWVSAARGGVFVVDNLDSRVKWLPDAVSAYSTGGARTSRKLYTDAGLSRLRARAWVALTSANPVFAGDVGLSDRLLVVGLSSRPGETQDEALTEEVTTHRNGILRHVCDVLRKALRDQGTDPVYGRHPDFERWSHRLGRGMGVGKRVAEALEFARQEKPRLAMDVDDLGSALRELLGDEGFSGTAKELKTALEGIDEAFLGSWWTARKVGMRLNAIWPNVLKTWPKAAKRLDRKGIWHYDLKA